MRRFPRVVFLCLLIFMAVLINLSLKTPKGQSQSHSHGKDFVRDIQEIMPKCWTPAKKLLINIGCSSLTSDIQAEMSILLTSCLLMAKNHKPITCATVEFNFCRRGKCLVKCGLENGEKLAQNFGYNPFQVIHDAVPDLCAYFLRSETVKVAEVDWSELSEDISSHAAKNLISTTFSNFNKPDLLTLREVFYNRLEYIVSSNTLDNVASSQFVFVTVLLFDIFVLMVIMANLSS